MKIGRFEIELLSEGIFEIYEDGSYHKISTEEITQKKTETHQLRQTTAIGIDPILVKNDKQVVLLDTGLGWGLDHRSSYEHTSNLKTNLDIFGLKPEDVTHVVLSHLHYDHAAGSTFVDNQSRTQLTFPNAHYYLQKIEWLFALEQADEIPIPGENYLLDELYKLHAAQKLVLINDQYFELLPGISLIHTGGHTPGHQIVKITDKKETAYYLGDLVPSEAHLNHYFSKNDTDPIQSKKAKTLILRQALKEQARLIFYHSIHTKAGTLTIDTNHRYTLTEPEGSYSV